MKVCRWQSGLGEIATWMGFYSDFMERVLGRVPRVDKGYKEVR